MKSCILRYSLCKESKYKIYTLQKGKTYCVHLNYGTQNFLQFILVKLSIVNTML